LSFYSIVISISYLNLNLEQKKKIVKMTHFGRGNDYLFTFELTFDFLTYDSFFFI